MLAAVAAGDEVWLAGERGTILHSGDAGRTWEQSPTPASVTLTRIAFAGGVAPGVGLAVGHGGLILRTGDRGRTWRRVSDGRAPNGAGIDKPLFAVCFAGSRGRAFAVGAFGTVMRSDDRGETWSAVADATIGTDRLHLYGLACVGDAVFVAAEQGVVYRSVDAGDAFVRLDTGYDGTFLGVAARPDGVVVAYGLRGSVWRSGDGGRGWSRVEVGEAGAINAAATLADGRLMLVPGSGRLLVSDSGWTDFSAFAIAKGNLFTDATQTSDGSVVISGFGGSGIVAH